MKFSRSGTISMLILRMSLSTKPMARSMLSSMLVLKAKSIAVLKKRALLSTSTIPSCLWQEFPLRRNLHNERSVAEKECCVLHSFFFVFRGRMATAARGTGTSSYNYGTTFCKIDDPAADGGIFVSFTDLKAICQRNSMFTGGCACRR